MPGLRDVETGVPIAQDGTDYGGRRGPAHVAAPSEIPATLTQTHIADLTTTRQRISLPSGAKWVHIHYWLLPGATATSNQYLKVALNATSDADAAGKLATVGGHIPIRQGEDFPPLAFSDDNLCTRVDVAAAEAVGSEKTMLRVISGVA